MREEITFSRNAEAIMIPSGEKVLVPVGAQATITQSLGGTYTLITDRGLMVRISGKEVEAIGKTPVEQQEAVPEDLTPEKLEAMVWDALKTCYDPEIPVNIVDLGLVYLCELNEVETKVKAVEGVADAKVELVWEPPWKPDMMSKVAKVMLGF